MNTDSSSSNGIKTIRVSTDCINITPDDFSETVRAGSMENNTTEKYSHDDGKTRIFRSAQATEHTAIRPDQWIQACLVAITGPLKGQYYPLVYGYNHIGREDSNNVCLAGDDSISKHQLIIHYNKHKRVFYASKDPRTNQITTTDDGDLIISEVELEPGCNLIMSDDTTLKLIPFCDESFAWDYSNLQNIHEVPNLPKVPDFMLNAGHTITIDTEDLDTQITERYERKDESVTRLIRSANAAPTEVKKLSKDFWVQGWLLAVSGPMKGRAFPIRYGFNHVGRKENNTIVLADDPSISGEQLLIVYNQKHKKFYVEKSPQSHQLTEFDDGDIINLATELRPGAQLIMTQETTLRFIPLCGENFSWDYSK